MAVNFGVNYLAVIVAAIVAVIIGFIWYQPAVFGNRWSAYLGRTPTNARPPVSAVVTGVAAALVNAWVLAVLALNLGGTQVGDGAMLGFMAWLGFMATRSAAMIAFEGRPWGLWVLNGGHDLLAQVLMGAIVTAWH